MLEELQIDARDLQLMLNGVPQIEVHKWRKWTTVECTSPEETQVVEWFFEIIEVCSWLSSLCVCSCEISSRSLPFFPLVLKCRLLWRLIREKGSLEDGVIDSVLI